MCLTFSICKWYVLFLSVCLYINMKGIKYQRYVYLLVFFMEVLLLDF